LTDHAALELVVANILSECGSVYGVVNNAGFGGPFHKTHEVTLEEWHAIFALNVTAPFVICRAVLPTMQRSGRGRIVNIASIMGFLGGSGSSTYAASKHALIGYTKSLAAEWGPSGICINAICPGYTETAMTASMSQEAREQIERKIPIARFAHVSDIAETVKFLMSESAQYINGASLVVDGGMTAGLL
jgi:3-oxoacyl-[acyl-carrier protein] reductase